MKLLKTVLLILLGYSTTGLIAQESRFKEGEPLNVWASSGLNMREKPDAKSLKLTTIPYGAKVIVQPNIGVKIPFEVEEFKGFIVKGYWLLVKYGNTEGFVFDGFLSRLPAPVSKEKDENIENYLKKHIGTVGQKYDIRIYDSAVDSMRNLKPHEKYNLDSLDMYSYKQKFKKDIVYEYSSGEGGMGETIELMNVSLYEAYFLIKTFPFYPETDILSFNKKEQSIEMKPKEEGAGCYYTIKKIGKKVIIEGGCGC